MKKEKKKKLKKKDRFKEIKKAAVPMYTAPLFLKKAYGIETVAENGIFQIGEDSFSKLYRVSISDQSVKACDVFYVLREYDFKFRIYYIHEDIFISIIFTSGKDDAWVTCDEIYKRLSSQLAELSIMLEDVNADDRFKLAHGIILNDVNLPFNSSYFDNDFVLSWKDVFELSGIQENIDYFVRNNESFKIYFVREFSSRISDFIKDIFNMDEVKEVVTQFDPVSDMAVKSFFKKNYMGTENILENLARNNPRLCNIYATDIKDDSRYFTMCGVMFIVQSDNPDVDDKINFTADRYDVDVSYFHVSLLDIYKNFLPFGRWNISESRNMSSEAATMAFLPQYLMSDDRSESVDDIMLDVSSFEYLSDDDVDNDVNYNIDDYDDEDDEDDEDDDYLSDY